MEKHIFLRDLETIEDRDNFSHLALGNLGLVVFVPQYTMSNIVCMIFKLFYVFVL